MTRARRVRLWTAALSCVVAGSLGGVGCKSTPDTGKDHVDGSACVLQGSFHGACGGTVSATGATPWGAFAASDIHVALSSTCGAAGVERYLGYLEIAYGGAGDFVRLTLPPPGDGGAAGLLGSHAVSVTIVAPSVCVTTTTSGVVDVTAGDDPATAFAAQSGTVTGTFQLGNDGFSVSGSFASPYCRFYDCPGSI